MFCEAWPDLQYFIFTNYVPHLLYYSHIPAALIALMFGFFVFLKSRFLEGKILFFISVLFFLWTSFNLVLWVSPDSQLNIFLWSFFGILTSLLFVSSLYFVYAFIDKKDVGLSTKIIFLILLLPSIVLAPTSYNLHTFNIVACEAVENISYTSYYYFTGFIVFIWILILAINRYRKAEDDFKKQIVYLTVGIEFFLLSFFTTGFFASYLVERGLINDFGLEQYGLFGMTFFMGVLAYLVVKFKAFNIKLLAAQALVVAIILLIASQFAFIRNNTNRILTGITLVVVSVFGWWLVRSVAKVDEQREELEVVNKELERLDKTKNEFINIASHQLRTPITVIRGVVSMIQQGDMDKLPAEARAKFYDGAMIKCNKLEEIINDILNATSLANNKFNVMDRKAEDIEVKKFFVDMVDSFKVETMERNINLSVGSLDESVPVIQGQRKYIEEAFTNLITNAIKYTPSSKATSEIRNTRDDSAEAKITISNKREGDFVIFSVKDNGIGIPAEEIPHLFQKFFRAKNATAMYVDGTGLGLFIIKEVAQGHGGDVWVESEVGKGTEFFIKLPIKQTGKVDVKKFIEAQANLKM